VAMFAICLWLKYGEKRTNLRICEDDPLMTYGAFAGRATTRMFVWVGVRGLLIRFLDCLAIIRIATSGLFLSKLAVFESGFDSYHLRRECPSITGNSNSS
jgi:hypothetical protein